MDDKETLYRLDEYVRNHIRHSLRRVEALQWGLFVAVSSKILVDLFVL